MTRHGYEYMPRLRSHRALRLKEFTVPDHEHHGDQSREVEGEDVDEESHESFIKSIFGGVCETVEAVCFVLPPKAVPKPADSPTSAHVPQASFKYVNLRSKRQKYESNPNKWHFGRFKGLAGPLLASMLPGLSPSTSSSRPHDDSNSTSVSGGKASRGALPMLLDASDTACALAVPVCNLIAVMDARGIIAR